MWGAFAERILVPRHVVKTGLRRVPDGLANVGTKVRIELKVLHLLVERLHLFVEPVHVKVEAEVVVPLAHFVFAELDRDLLFRVFAQDGQSHISTFRITADKLRQLVGFHQDLVVKHLQDVVLLNSRGGRGTVRHHVIDDEPETLG